MGQKSITLTEGWLHVIVWLLIAWTLAVSYGSYTGAVAAMEVRAHRAADR